MSLRLLALSTAAALAAACGGSSGPGPTGPTEAFDVDVVVFLDENGNGAAEASEGARIPEVEVVVAGRTARTERVTGRALVRGVPAGRQTASVRAATLPPYYAAGQPVPVQVPQGGVLQVPVRLPIGANQPYEYMAFGDSITSGETASDMQGYRRPLQDALRAYYGRGNVPNRGRPGSRTPDGALRIAESLVRMRPAFTLILYGTNDWNDVSCKNGFPCYTIDSLREIIQVCRDAESLPFLGTIPPVNTADTRRAPPERQKWVADMNVLVRQLASEEDVVLADVHEALLKGGDLTELFVDHVHPTDRGYEIIAEEFFRAITTPGASGRSLGAGGSLPPEPLLLRPAGPATRLLPQEPEGGSRGPAARPARERLR